MGDGPARHGRVRRRLRADAAVRGRHQGDRGGLPRLPQPAGERVRDRGRRRRPRLRPRRAVPEPPDRDHQPGEPAIAAGGGQDRAQAREAGHRVRQRADHLRRGHLTAVADDVRFPPAESACLRLNQEVMLDFDTCYRAGVARDPRLDGRFFTGVTSTGIYCRPVCPARTPARRNMRFFPHAGAAEAAGFRACRRCRPEASPGSPDWNARADLAARAVRLIADGYADEHGIRGLARRLAVTERHLRRLLLAELGTTPIALARTTRLQTARRLLAETDMPVTEIAFASGFASVRQFNASFREAYGRPPTALRTRAPRPSRRRGGRARPGAPATGGMRVPDGQGAAGQVADGRGTAGQVPDGRGVAERGTAGQRVAQPDMSGQGQRDDTAADGTWL